MIKSCPPAFGGKMAAAKIQTLKGLSVEIFPALCEAIRFVS